MQRVTAPPDQPQLYRTQSLTLDSVDLQATSTAHEIKLMPESTILRGDNLKRIKSFKQLRRSYKLSNQHSVFVNDMQQLLSHLDVQSNKMNLELLLELCNCAEQYFIYGTDIEREQSKSDAIRELLTPFFIDESILEKMLESISHKIIRSTAIKRALKRSRVFLKKILKYLL